MSQQYIVAEHNVSNRTVLPFHIAPVGSLVTIVTEYRSGVCKVHIEGELTGYGYIHANDLIVATNNEALADKLLKKEEL